MNRKDLTTKAVMILAVLVWMFVPAARPAPAQETAAQPISVAAGFAEREIAADEQIQLVLSRSLTAEDGRLAVFIGTTDVSSLFSLEEKKFTYRSGMFSLPAGENILTVYLVSPGENWKKMAEFNLRVRPAEPEDTAADQSENFAAEADLDGQLAEPGADEGEAGGLELTPNLSINVKGQNQIRTFPADSAPERNPFTDVAGQGSLAFRITRRGWNFSSQFEFAGSSFQQEALRFGELADRAPKIDLASYLIEVSRGRYKFNLGHISFGSNRHLISSFSSRGFSVTAPIGRQNEISFAAANGTSIVGYDNFIGITRRKHSVVSATFAREFIKERPGGLRLEFSVMRGSLLPLTNFNQGEINDAEKSLGFGFRLFGSDKNQRLRYELGFTRSKFTNPNDPNLDQNFEVTGIRAETKNARYGEISFDFLRGLKLWREKKLKLTGTYRHEEVAPLFRSIGTFTQADRRKHQFEVTGSFGELNFGFGNLRERDNLDDIASILKTLNRRNNVIISLPLNTFFTGAEPIRWLPNVSYTFDLTHQFGAFLPTAGLFNDPSQVPDQKSYSQAFNAQWMISDNLSIGYVYTRAFQDNRQPGRENADLASVSNAVTVSYKPFASLGLDFDFSRERQKSFEQQRIDRTFRLGTRAVWQTPFLENSTLSGGFSFTLAGDRGNLTDARNGEFDLQWAYGFSFGEKKYRKLSGQFFIRYANRYGDTIDRQFLFSSINRSQAFNLGLTFNFF